MLRQTLDAQKTWTGKEQGRKNFYERINANT